MTQQVVIEEVRRLREQLADAERQRDGNERLYKSIQKVYLQTYSELEAARAQVAALTEALEAIAEPHPVGGDYGYDEIEWRKLAYKRRNLARAALAGSPANTENE